MSLPLPLGPLAACIRLVKTIPAECQPYVLLSIIMGVIFIAAIVRLWLLRRVEEKLLKNKDALEKQIVEQQKSLMAARQDANAWRAEMQRQFDLFRHMASDQLKVEEKRFDDLLQKSRDREHSLQTSLDIAKQMCAELPGTKARLMQLESVFGLDAGEGLSAPAIVPAASDAIAIAPLPDLDGSTITIPEPVTEEATAPEIEEEVVTAQTEETESELQSQLRLLQQQNTQLQQALTAARLRSRIRERSTPRHRNGKN